MVYVMFFGSEIYENGLRVIFETRLQCMLDCYPTFTYFTGKVCPIEAPGVLKFKEACCVGISRKEVLPLKNPTDRWIECAVQVWPVSLC